MAEQRRRTASPVTSPLWLPFGLIVLAWGVQLTLRGIERTRRSGMGRQAAVYGRIVPGAINTLLFGPSFVVLVLAVGVRAVTFWLGTLLLLLTMWGLAGIVGGRLRLHDLAAEAEAEAEAETETEAAGEAEAMPRWTTAEPADPSA